MLTTIQLNEIEATARRGDCLTKDTVLSMVQNIRKLMAENMELCSSMDKIKSAVSDATNMLDKVRE